MSQPNASEHGQHAAAPRRAVGRIVGGIVLVLFAVVLFVVGLQAIIDPSHVVAGSSNSARSPDTDAEAQVGGLLLCFFGITVLGFGIALFKKKPAAGTPSSG
jgi:uncharacterized membrane protein YidH (DUF202 family)